MAEEEPILSHPPTPEMARHVHDYDRFTSLFKWGALAALITGIVILLILY